MASVSLGLIRVRRPWALVVFVAMSKILFPLGVPGAVNRGIFRCCCSVEPL